jgi:hypothetical protein
MASRSTFPIEYLSAADYETHFPDYSVSGLSLQFISNSRIPRGVQFDMSAFTENSFANQAEAECDETAISLHDFFIHHIPAPTASDQVVRDWIKCWFVGTMAGTHKALNTSAELPGSSLHSIDMKRLKLLRLNGFSIRELTEKAVGLHLNMLFPEGVAAAIAADIQRAKTIEVEIEEKLIAVSNAIQCFLSLSCFQSWAILRVYIFTGTTHSRRSGSCYYSKPISSRSISPAIDPSSKSSLVQCVLRRHGCW